MRQWQKFSFAAGGHPSLNLLKICYVLLITMPPYNLVYQTNLKNNFLGGQYVTAKITSKASRGKTDEWIKSFSEEYTVELIHTWQRKDLQLPNS